MAKTRYLSSVGLVRLRIQEFADKEGWTIKEVLDRSGVPYGTVKTYMRLICACSKEQSSI